MWAGPKGRRLPPLELLYDNAAAAQWAGPSVVAALHKAMDMSMDKIFEEDEERDDNAVTHRAGASLMALRHSAMTCCTDITRVVFGFNAKAQEEGSV